MRADEAAIRQSRCDSDRIRTAVPNPTETARGNLVQPRNEDLNLDCCRGFLCG